jgi:hypothetical protein
MDVWSQPAPGIPAEEPRAQRSWIKDLESNKHNSRTILPENITGFRGGCGIFLLGSQILLLAADTLGVSVVCSRREETLRCQWLSPHRMIHRVIYDGHKFAV